jgi:5,10-methylenetetrahydrofolate reductase/methionine synthase I (cobalamin-dependent)
MKQSFKQALENRVLLTDGGIGTEIYSRGFFVNRCYEELNLTNSNIIKEIHTSYADAGAEIITTNTFGANKLQLSSFGLIDQQESIIRKGVEIAREVAKDDLFVAGSIGPITKPIEDNTIQIEDLFKEQADLLIDSKVDLIYLESFTSIEQLKSAYDIIQKTHPETDIIPGISFSFIENNADTYETILQQVAEWPNVTIICISGGSPSALIDHLPSLKQAAGESVKIALRPSAGNPTVIDGRTLYLASPEYLAEYTRRFVQKGAGMVGGDAGITPMMIKEMSSFLRSIQPRQVVRIVSQEEENEITKDALEPIPLKGRSPFGRILDQHFTISVELDPPKGVDASKSVAGAKFLYEKGIDAINIADGPRASGRMSPIALSALVKREVPIETIIHTCCRDRNLLALQMDLISANAMGLKNLMVITGDPPKMGMYPDATAVFDLDAIGLVRFAALLNRGLDFAQRPLKGQTSFVIGVGCNPGATDVDLEVHRYEEKVKAGAEFVFSQPIYDIDILQNFLSRIKHVKPIPFFIGVLPLASYKNAEFFNDNVPGMQVPPQIMKRMSIGSTKEEQREEGINIAAEILKEAKQFDLVKGSYIFPPFGRYERILDVIEKAEIR